MGKISFKNNRRDEGADGGDGEDVVKEVLAKANTKLAEVPDDDTETRTVVARSALEAIISATDQETYDSKREPEPRPRTAPFKPREPESEGADERRPIVARPRPTEERLSEQVGNYKEVMDRLKSRGGQTHHATLPSLGIFNSDIPGGRVVLKPLTARTELDIARNAAKGKGREGKIVDSIIASCVVSPSFDVSTLCPEDKFYLIVYLRGISFGNEYNVVVKCPECEHGNKDVMDLSRDIFVMNIQQAAECDDDEIADRARQLIERGFISDRLPASGLDITYTTTFSENDAKVPKGMSSIDSKLIGRYASFIRSIGGISDPKLKENIVRELMMADTSYIREIADAYTFGVARKIEFTCELCGHEFETSLPIDESFFSTGRTRKS